MLRQTDWFPLERWRNFQENYRANLPPKWENVEVWINSKLNGNHNLTLPSNACRIVRLLSN
ncbi:MAG: hypothetical protein ACTS4W_00420 [Candidatus Hodgkinia cicadicola]